MFKTHESIRHQCKDKIWPLPHFKAFKYKKGANVVDSQSYVFQETEIQRYYFMYV
jgi:hypothetical protein